VITRVIRDKRDGGRLDNDNAPAVRRGA
jgi:hypothetical protein